MTTLITYATPDYDTIYAKFVGKSVENLCISPHIHHKVHKAIDWVGSCNLKPGIILQELKKGNPILYVDSDAEIKSRDIMDIDTIVPPEYIGACVFLDWHDWLGIESSTIEPLTATLFFRPTASPLIEQWHKLCENSHQPDNKHFQQLVDYKHPGIFHLPLKWCYIDSLPKGGKGKIPCDNPLIIQYQISRQMRHT